VTSSSPSARPGADWPLLPPGFQFGTSTGAYQVEGAATEDGRGPSIWDAFTARPGRVVDGSTGALGSDLYHHLDEDTALMQGLGARGHRFSISWPRIQPTGRGPANAKGLEFYDRLVDTLLAHDIAPMATLYHWDLPQSLEDDGGWLNPATVERFAEYAAIVGARLADRVEHWIPVHEPNVAATLGYAVGTHAPGRMLNLDALWASHHLLLAHGRGAIELRRAGATSVGCSNNHAPVWPATDGDADVGASKIFDALWNSMFLEPMLLGRYPADLMPLMEDLLQPGDLATIRQPLDFYGVSYHNPIKVAATDDEADLPFEQRTIVGYPLTDAGWPVVPDALREWLIIFRARYRAALPPIFITESGCAYNTDPDERGVVDDQARIAYLRLHVNAVQEAVQRGVDVRAYYARSFLDGFEWADGYTQRFGLVHVDRDSLERTPKASYHWYASLIAAQPQHV